MVKWIKVLALVSVCFVAIGTGTWGISFLMSPMNFFSTVGIIACSAAIVLLVFGGTNKMGVKWRSWGEARREKTRAKDFAKGMKIEEKRQAKKAKRLAKELKANK